MINKVNIERILKINGAEVTSPDEKIRSILLSARYSDDEVDTAIMVLRENENTHKTSVTGLHKVFRTDEGLAASEISELLGIDVDLSDRVSLKGRDRSLSSNQIFLITIFSVLIAFGSIAFYMFVTNTGLFYVPSAS